MPRLTCQSFVLVLSLAFLSSCEVYNFSKPQPVDAKNIYEFPTAWRGIWVHDGDSVIIGKNYFISTSFQTRKIKNGYWVEPLTKDQVASHDSLGNLNRHKYDGGLKKIVLDSSRNPVDTVEVFRLINGKIYEIDKHHLSPGAPYTVSGDTLMTRENGSIVIHLGPGAFLRQISDQQYIVNVRNELIFNEDEGLGWWQVVLAQITTEQELKFSTFDSEIETHPSLIYESGDSYYFEASWKKAELTELIKKGFFDDDSEGLKMKEKISLKKYPHDPK